MFQICALVFCPLRAPSQGSWQNREFESADSLPSNCQGSQLERALQKIVFRLDAIDDNLQSHALLKQMRALNASIKAADMSQTVSMKTKCGKLPATEEISFV